MEKILLYADDIVFTVANPRESTKYLLEVNEYFGSNSGCRINFEKIVLMGINVSLAGKKLMVALICSLWKIQNISYLGIHFSQDII